MCSTQVGLQYTLFTCVCVLGFLNRIGCCALPQLPLGLLPHINRETPLKQIPHIQAAASVAVRLRARRMIGTGSKGLAHKRGDTFLNATCFEPPTLQSANLSSAEPPTLIPAAASQQSAHLITHLCQRTTPFQHKTQIRHRPTRSHKAGRPHIPENIQHTQTHKHIKRGPLLLL